MYKTAILGCGGGSRKHMDAYKHITRGEVTAICDIQEDFLNKYGDDFSIKNRYTSLEEMLTKEKPDLLHVINRPSLRLETMKLISDFGVPAAIIEKPVAMDTSDLLAIEELERNSSTRFIINHQVRFHPKIQEFHRAVQAGDIGELKLIDASALMNLSGQGTHLLDLMALFTNGARPKKIIAQMLGAGEIDTKHPSPDTAMAYIEYESGVKAQILCGKDAPSVTGDERPGRSKRIAFSGTRGHLEWQMGYWFSGKIEGSEDSEKSYEEEDEIGQTELTEAAFDWLDDNRKTHPNNLSRSLEQFKMILAMYDSALNHKTVNYPYSPKKDYLKNLKNMLKEGSCE